MLDPNINCEGIKSIRRFPTQKFLSLGIYANIYLYFACLFVCLFACVP